MVPYVTLIVRNGIPSGPGALFDADVNIAVWTSHGVTGIQGIFFFGRFGGSRF
jgi:hypothetical protein